MTPSNSFAGTWLRWGVMLELPRLPCTDPVADLEARTRAEHDEAIAKSEEGMFQAFWECCNPTASIDNLQQSLTALADATTTNAEGSTSLVLPDGKRFSLAFLLLGFSEFEDASNLSLESRYLVRQIVLRLVSLYCASDRQVNIQVHAAKCQILKNFLTFYKFSKLTIDGLSPTRSYLKEPAATFSSALGQSILFWNGITPVVDGTLVEFGDPKLDKNVVFLADGTVNRIVTEDLEAGQKAMGTEIRSVPELQRFQPSLIAKIIQYISLYVFVPTQGYPTTI